MTTYHVYYQKGPVSEFAFGNPGGDYVVADSMADAIEVLYENVGREDVHSIRVKELGAAMMRKEAVKV